MRVTEVNVYVKSTWNHGKGKAAALMVCSTRDGQDRKKMVVECGADNKNRMHLEIINTVLGLLAYKCSVGIYIDDLSIRNAIENEWWIKWQRNDWKRTSGKDIANRETWEQLAEKLKKHDVGICKYINTFDEELKKEIEKEK